MLDAHRRGRGDLVGDCGRRRLGPVRGQDRRRSPPRRGDGRRRRLTSAGRRGSGAAMADIITSTEPATGAEVWSGPTGDPAAEVAAARGAWPEWAAHSVSYRMEALRRFANEVRAREAEFADLIARETGKPFWEAKTEVAS